MAWMPDPEQPHFEPYADWSADWPVRLALPANAPDEAEFDCDTEPSPPELPTRTGELSFDAPSCAAIDAAPASCELHASWPMACVPEPPDWCADCTVPFRFPATACDDTSFDCDTEPPPPSLPTRTGLLLFEAPFWIAADSAPALWSFDAD